jgi:hypothetical protein
MVGINYLLHGLVEGNSHAMNSIHAPPFIPQDIPFAVLVITYFLWTNKGDTPIFPDILPP